MDPVGIYFVGTAGAGKTSLTRAMQAWMELKGLDSVTVNLDPGAESLPYSPEYDIREWLSLRDVMEEYGLGPNGAQIACADMLALRVGEIREILDGFRSPYILIDTPGQLELFAFRRSSRRVVEALTGERSALAFLIDPVLAKVPSGFISQLMLSATVQFRFAMPMMNVVSKADLLEEEELARLRRWAEDGLSLQAAAQEELAGAQVQFNVELFRALESVGAFRNFITASAEEMSGMEDIYAAVQAHFFAGEDLTKD
ncbi:MAG: ATP/GTP-binding protein [Thermoplasmata archaeon]